MKMLFWLVMKKNLHFNIIKYNSIIISRKSLTSKYPSLTEIDEYKKIRKL